MKRIFTSLLMLLACTGMAWAVPALPVKRTVTMPDGTAKTVTLTGDEHLSFYLTDDGQRGRIDKEGRFALLSDNEFSTMQRRAAQQRSQADSRRTARMKAAPRRVAATTGSHKGLVILVAFSDLDFSMSAPRATYQRFFNEEGYSDGGMHGSVHDYFRDQSYGQFDLTFDVYGPVKLSKSYTYYGQNSSERNDVNVRSMVTESLQQLDSQIDYSRYDWDGDGEVDQVFFIYAGYGEAQGAPTNTIWPHESSIASEGLVLDGVRLGTYGCSCELMGASGSTMDGIGTACHEFTHCLGIMDMYDTQYNGGYGMASWDLMSAGSYNNNSRTPAGYTAYERWVSGWMEPVELKGDVKRIRDMKPLVESPEAYILYNERNRNEYYLLENRQLTSWDAGLPGHGMLVVHVDYDAGAWSVNTINTTPSHQRVTVVPADNNTTETWSGMAGDPYPGTADNHALTNLTTPAATLFNRNTGGSLFLNKPIENIQETGDGLISFVALHPDLPVPTPKAEKAGENAFVISWGAVEEATSYELKLTEIPASKHDLDECLIMKEDFAKCVTKSAGFTDISSKLSSYLSHTNWQGSKLYTSPSGLRFGTSSEAGYLQTGGYQTPESGEVTLVVDVAPFAEGTPAEGEVRFVYDGRWSTYTAQAFSIDKAGRYLLHCTGLTGVGAIDLRPSSRMYITYLALYEGYWTEEELNGTNVKGTSIAQAPRRISTQTLTTTETRYRVADANPTSTYTFSVRALTDEGIISQWSEEVTFSFGETGIAVPEGETPTRQADRGWFNLAGQQLKAPMQQGIYVRNGRKYIVR